MKFDIIKTDKGPFIEVGTWESMIGSPRDDLTHIILAESDEFVYLIHKCGEPGRWLSFGGKDYCHLCKQSVPLEVWFAYKSLRNE